ncbi:YcjX family protein [Shewanella algae]|uniref:YcjX family protein n=1 Tax=Shewanella algae TaxID=38313 RepID=UPI001BEDCB19|nr:YcjX family protein [Shewanella algae]BCV54373.1 ATPase [Shewanella algae]
MASVRQKFGKLKHKTRELAQRTTDRHLRLAVTGLSGAGKTAFITALVDRLLRAGTEADGSGLPLFQVCRDGRLLGVRRVLQPDLTIASFDFDAAIASLTAAKPSWPASTRSISELRLTLKYVPTKGMLAKLADSAKLHLDIVDYPGEWLLDLPMLSQDFNRWSETRFARQSTLESSPLYPKFAAALATLDLYADADDQALAAIAESYRLLLLDLVQQQGFYQAQPGRMLLPGELAGTPILAFFPLLPEQLQDKQQLASAGRRSNYQVLRHRYLQYLAKVVKPFYQEYFAGFDRQLILVDCFSALNRGKAQFEDMAEALNAICASFQYGQSSLLRRLFAPRIDTLLFAASKVDQVTRDQQGNVLSLLSAMLAPSRQQAGFAGSRVETMAISAIKATRHGMVKDADGVEVEVVCGRRMSDGQKVTLYPGEVPRALPEQAFWQRQGFHFCEFAPPDSQPELGYEHIRLDHLLEFLLGDKLR